MIFTVIISDAGDVRLELDEEGLEYMQDAIETLLEMEPGFACEAPTLDDNGVGVFAIKRV